MQDKKIKTIDIKESKGLGSNEEKAKIFIQRCTIPNILKNINALISFISHGIFRLIFPLWPTKNMDYC